MLHVKLYSIENYWYVVFRSPFFKFNPAHISLTYKNKTAGEIPLVLCSYDFMIYLNVPSDSSASALIVQVI